MAENRHRAAVVGIPNEIAVRTLRAGLAYPGPASFTPLCAIILTYVGSVILLSALHSHLILLLAGKLFGIVLEAKTS